MDESKQQNDMWLSGKLLIAMPQLQDDRFDKTVIFMCAHDKNGAMGVVINKRLDSVSAITLLDDLNISYNPKMVEDLDILEGGPVEKERGFLLHDAGFVDEDSIKVSDEFVVSGTLTSLEKALNDIGLNHKLLALGYAGWGAGQLEQEIADNAWLICDADHDIVFGRNQSEKWDQAAKKIGVDWSLLSGHAGRA